jgi:hypothetical protein
MFYNIGPRIELKFIHFVIILEHFEHIWMLETLYHYVISWYQKLSLCVNGIRTLDHRIISRVLHHCASTAVQHQTLLNQYSTWGA